MVISSYILDGDYFYKVTQCILFFLCTLEIFKLYTE